MPLRGLSMFLGTLLTLVLLTGGPARSQTQQRLSAREIFYSAPAEAPPAKKAAPKPVAPAKKKAEVEVSQTKPVTPPPPPLGSPSAHPPRAGHPGVLRQRGGLSAGPALQHSETRKR